MSAIDDFVALDDGFYQREKPIAIGNQVTQKVEATF